MRFNYPFGRLLKAIRENETICSALAKNDYWTKMKAFIVGSFFAGIAGGLYARYTTVVVPECLVLLLVLLHGFL
jgi:branched-chain amino acid transport system permease protein